MDIVENTLPISLDEFLEQPLFCFLATVTADGLPRISPLWYLWEDNQIWIIANKELTYTTRIKQTPNAALAIVDYDVHTGLVHHVGMRGEATLEPLDPAKVDRLLERYLGPNRDQWDNGFLDLDPSKWALIRFDPKSVVARGQSFTPSLNE